MTHRVRVLTESALLIALATVLSVIKLASLPYGGSITFASMLPILLIAYRHGYAWGFGSAVAYGAIQQLLGLHNLSYVTTALSIIAVILLDYILAYTSCGVASFTRNMKDARVALAFSAFLACLIRYLFHVLSGATVWAGLSIPTKAALIYSIAYNATYMIPETIVTVIMAWYLASLIDFQKEKPERRIQKLQMDTPTIFRMVAFTILAIGMTISTVLFFGNIQDAETGLFSFASFSQIAVLFFAVLGGTVLLFGVFFFLSFKKRA